MRNLLLKSAVFVLAAFGGGAAYSAVKVIYFGDFDPKFSSVPDLALQLEITEVLLLAVVGAVVLALATFIVWERVPRPAQEDHGSRLGLVALLGSLYWPFLSLIAKLIEQVLPREAWSNAVIGICIVIAYPLVVGLLQKHYPRQS